MYLSEAIGDFIESVEIEGGRSKSTADNYRLYLERFVEFADDIKVNDIKSETVRKYRLWLNRYENDQGQELGTTTQSYHLIALRGFLQYLSRRGIATLTPEKIELPKISRKQVTFLHVDEVERILDAVPPDDSEQNLRDRAILELLFCSAIQ